jgi:hypothetical protein
MQAPSGCKHAVLPGQPKGIGGWARTVAASDPVVRKMWMCQHSGYLSPERIASHLHPYGHLDASLVPERRQESGAFWNPCLPIFALPEQVHLLLAMIIHNDFEVI